MRFIGYFSVVIVIVFFALLVHSVVGLASDIFVEVDVPDVEANHLLRTIPISVNYRSYGYVFATIAEDDLDRLDYIGVRYEILDTEAWSASYYIVHGVGRDDAERFQDEGSVLFQNGTEALVKIDEDRAGALVGVGFRVTRVLRESLPLADNLFERAYRISVPVQQSDVIGVLTTRVSLELLRQYVQRLQDFRTRFFASDSIDAAAQWLYDRFVEYGYTEVIFDDFVEPDYDVPVRNVIATKPGVLYPDSVIIIGGHYDSIVHGGGNSAVWAPGADDNASGTAGVLEAARVLADVDFDCTVKFACWTAEEIGLHGSRHYATRAYEHGERIGLYINYDMLGYLDHHDPLRNISIKRNPTAQPYADMMAEMAARYSTLIPEQENAIGGSDHAPFMQRGYDILYVEEGDPYPYIHTGSDIIGNMNMTYMYEAVKMGLAALATVAGPPSSLPPRDPVLIFEQYRVDDDSLGESTGNGNGYIDPGEIIELSLSIVNYGEIDAYNVSGLLMTGDQYVTILEDEQLYGDIPPATCATCSSPYRIRISPGCPNGRYIDMSVLLTAAGRHQWTMPFTLRLRQPDLAYSTFELVEVSGDGDGVLDPGETISIIVTLENTGYRMASGVRADLETNDSDIEMNDPTSTFADVDVHNTGSNESDPFVVSLHDTAVPHVIRFTFHLSEGGGWYRRDQTFRLRIGQGKVLLVADDNGVGIEPYYTETLRHLGVPYDVLSIQGSYKSVHDEISGYDEVIWFTGPVGSNTLMPEDQQTLTAFLEGGGRLLLSGSLIGYDIGQTLFYRDYLHGSFISFMTMLHHLRGEPFNPILGALNVNLASRGDNAQSFTGETDPIPPAVSLFNYNRNTGEGPGIIRSSGSGALVVETGTYKLAYLSFGLEGIEPLSVRADVTERVLLWFKEPGVNKGDVDGSGLIDALDVVRTVNVALGLYEPTAAERIRADMNYDGEIAVQDVLQIVKTIVRLSGHDG